MTGKNEYLKQGEWHSTQDGSMRHCVPNRTLSDDSYGSNCAIMVVWIVTMLAILLYVASQYVG